MSKKWNNLIILLIIGFTVVSCNNSNSYINKKKVSFEQIGYYTSDNELTGNLRYKTVFVDTIGTHLDSVTIDFQIINHGICNKHDRFDITELYYYFDKNQIPDINEFRPDRPYKSIIKGKPHIIVKKIDEEIQIKVN